MVKVFNKQSGKYNKPWVDLDIERRAIVERCDSAVSADCGNDKSVRILQITDCHLGQTVGEQLAGMDTDASLDYVLDRMLVEECESADCRPDLVLATGDLANHGSAAAYQRLDKKLSRLAVPSIWLPGNHDKPQLMLDAVGAARLPGVCSVGNWAFILLDSTVPDEVGGTLGAEELARLAEVLRKLPQNCYIAVCVHHQVLPVGSGWLDEQQIKDHEKLIELLSDDSRLRMVVSGHVHQESRMENAVLPGVAFITSPSSCIQFAPHSNDFKIDNKLPGYRWFDLHSDGRFDTGVVRVEREGLTMDLASSGY